MRIWRNRKGSAQGAARTTKAREKIAPRSVVRDRQKGSAIVEAALMMPWICFLFVGILDSGFYTYAAMATQNAARAVAIQSANIGGTLSAAAMCASAKRELLLLPNVGLAGNCAATQGAISNADPIWVCAGILNDTASAPCVPPAVACADCAGSGATGTNARSIQAVVTYRSIPLIPIPGILTKQLQLTRIAEARVIE
jgi:TadE-like protein